MGWYKARCQVRITTASFNFSEKTWTVEGYLDMLGPKGMQMSHSKMFKHSWHGSYKEISALQALLEEHCGTDLNEQEEMWNTLSTKDQQRLSDDINAKIERDNSGHYPIV